MISLLYDWSIYHFHLSTNRTRDRYFNDRTGQVLFVYITNDLALLLDIDTHPPHDVFADKKLLEILDNNLPVVLQEVKDVVGLSQNFSREDRYILRRAGVNEGIIEVNGKFVFPPGHGIVTSGHSSEASRMLMTFKRWLNTNQEKLSTSKQTLDEYFAKTHNLKRPISYKLVFTTEGPNIVDENSGVVLIHYSQTINV